MFDDLIILSLFWTIVVLAGVLFGWNLRAAYPERALARLLERTTQERNSLARLYTQVKHYYDLREVDLRKTTIELGNLREQAELYESERTLLLAAAQANTIRMEQAETNAVRWSERLPELEAEALRLQAENAQLEAELAQINSQIGAWKTLHADFAAMQRQLHDLEEKNMLLEQERRQLREQLEIARARIEQQVRELERYAIQVRQFSESASSSDGDSGPTQTPARPDDLLRIRGISTEHAGRLRDMGVISFVQISEWEDDDILQVAKILGISFTKIVQDDWVGQAQMLVAGSQN
jgi:predicted flap endonuclease-1-like 5' DNA nuclease